MWHYYKRFGQALWNGFKTATGEQMIGALLTIAILTCQIIFGVVHKEDVPGNAWSLVWPYVALVIGLLIWQMIKTPYRLDKQKEDETVTLKKLIQSLQLELTTLKQKLFAERPMLGLRVGAYAGKKNLLMIGHTVATPMSFYFTHLSGRPAGSVTVDPIYSYGGRFSLRLQGLPFLAKGADVETDFEIWENDKPPLKKALESIGWSSMISLFVFDKPDGKPILEYPATVRLLDLGEERTQEFTMFFDVLNYRFGFK